MAAALLQRKLAENGLADSYCVRSAGTWAQNGLPASAYARLVMAEKGLDLSSHLSHELTAQDVAQAALILVMTQYHKEALVTEFPEARDRVFLLSEMAGKHFDIADPFGTALINYQYCADELENLIEEGYEEILRLVG